MKNDKALKENVVNIVLAVFTIATAAVYLFFYA